MNKKIIAIVVLAIGCMVTQSRAQKALPPGIFDKPSMPAPSAIQPSRGEQMVQKVKDLPEQIRDLPYRGLRAVVGRASQKSDSDSEQHEPGRRRTTMGEKISGKVDNLADNLKDAQNRLKGAAIRAVVRGGYERHGDEEPAKGSQVESNIQWKKSSMTKEDAAMLNKGLKRDRDSKDVAKTSPEQALIATASNAKDEAQARIDLSKGRIADAEKIMNSQKQYLEAKEELERVRKEKMNVEAAQKEGIGHGGLLKLLTDDLKKAEEKVQQRQNQLNEQLGDRSLKAVQAEAAAAKKQIKAEEDQIKQADRIVTAASDRTKINNTIKMLEDRIAEDRELLKKGSTEEKNSARQRINNNEQTIKDNKRDLKEAEKILATEKLPTSKKTESSGMSTKTKIGIGAAVGVTGLAGAAGLVGATGLAAGGIGALSEESSSTAPSEEKNADQSAGESFEASPASEG